MRLNCKKIALLSAFVTRAIASRARITAARLDFLTTLVRGPRCQRSIAEVLCVSKSVVSRMAKALEQLGLISREVPRCDRRVRLVRLTASGRARFDELAEEEGDCLLTEGAQAQCYGEGYWMGDWDCWAAGTRRYRALFLTGDDTDNHPLPAMWVRRAAYRSAVLHFDLLRPDAVARWYEPIMRSAARRDARLAESARRGNLFEALGVQGSHGTHLAPS